MDQNLSDTQAQALKEILSFTVRALRNERENWGREAAEDMARRGVEVSEGILRASGVRVGKATLKALARRGYLKQTTVIEHVRETRPMWGHAHRQKRRSYSVRYTLTKAGLRAARGLPRTAATRVATRQIIKTAGEVRFIKDKSSDAGQWAWGDTGASERNIPSNFDFNTKMTKDIAKVLRSTNMALGHAMSAYTRFNKMKSAQISPDGSLGGRGYVQKINSMRRAYTNITEALSAISDTLYDEIQGPHWVAVIQSQDPEDKKEVEEILEDVEEIREDPEDWAEEQEEDMDEDL